MAPKAPRTPQQAIAWMRAQHKSGSTAWRGMCQSSVRQSWGLPGGVPSAKAALEQAKAAGKFVPKPAGMSLEAYERTLPVGSAVWTDRPGGSTYGHIILAGGRNKKIKRRIFWSVDIGAPGKISPVTLNAFVDRWGHQILGHAPFLSGHDLPVKPPKTAQKSKGKGKGKGKGKKK